MYGLENVALKKKRQELKLEVRTKIDNTNLSWKSRPERATSIRWSWTPETCYLQQAMPFRLPVEYFLWFTKIWEDINTSRADVHGTQITESYKNTTGQKLDRNSSDPLHRKILWYKILWPQNLFSQMKPQPQCYIIMDSTVTHCPLLMYNVRLCDRTGCHRIQYV